MSELELPNQPGGFAELLQEQGIIVPPGTLLHSSEMGIEVGVRRLYGVEAMLPAGGLGYLVLRQVEQVPDPYTAAFPEDHPNAAEFYNRRMSGLFVEAKVASAGVGHVFVARRSVLDIASRGAKLHMSTAKHFAAGKGVAAGNILDFDVSGLQVTRQLAVEEMVYSEPSLGRMVVAAVRGRTRSWQRALNT